MYELDEEPGRVEFSHNPFSMPPGGLEAEVSPERLKELSIKLDLPPENSDK